MNALRSAALFAGLALAAGCAPQAEALRRYTYPADFKYLPKEQVDSAMWTMARDVQEVERLLSAGPVGPGERAEVDKRLDDLVSLAASLETGGKSNHPRLDRYASDFRRDLERARDNARLEPPNYFLAGTLVGTCVRCHGPNEGPQSWK